MREKLRDLLQLFALPALAALLPWVLGFRILRRAARWSGLFPQESGAALRGAKTLRPPPDEAAWLWRHRLTRLVDHCDLYLSLSRSDAWLHKWVDVSGQWPQRGPFLAAFFHWGAGLWGLRHLRASGSHASFLSIHFDRQTFRAAPLRYWYARLRAWETGRAAAHPIIYTGSAPAAMRRLYRDGKNVTAALDVPFSQTRDFLPVRFLGQAAAFPKGVIRLATRMQIPIVIFDMSVDLDTGRRTLRISPPLLVADEAAFAQHSAERLEQLVEHDSAAWHMWADVETFFSRTDETMQNPS